MSVTRQTASEFLDRAPGSIIESGHADGTPWCHVLDADSIEAVNSALAIGRPLLIRGEPGTGKSQLARAVAVDKGWRFKPHAVDASTETRDLLWRLDGVARLAEAQLVGGLGSAAPADARDRLHLRNFVEPGPLWWGFDWAEAARQQARFDGKPVPAAGDAGPRCVVLIDEIDKADSSVPNGLLDALGHGRFEVHGLGEVRMDPQRPPLVILTTNEERALPDAFVRRCLVLTLALPDERSALEEYLVARGKAHFGKRCGAKVLAAAAVLIADDRGDAKAWRARGVAPPGLAEYIDLVRIVVERRTKDAERIALLDAVAKFTLRKHPDDPGT